MKPRRVLSHIAFTFFLLLSQQLGMAHAISHWTSDRSFGASREKPLPAEMQCSQCLAFAAIGSALNGSPTISCPALETPSLPIVAPVARLLPSAIRAFNSRAPPLPL